MADKTEPRLIPEITYAVFRQCVPSWNLPRQTLPNYDLSYCVAGNARYRINGRSHELEPGDLLCVPPGSLREAFTYPDRLMRVYAVNFHLQDSEGNPARLPLPLKTPLGKRNGLVRLFNELSFAWMEQQPGYVLKIHGLLMLILHRLYELCVYNLESAEDDYRIKKAVRYIASHFAEKITVEQMAALTRLGPHYFNTLFKEKTGLSMHQYLIKTRIRNAYNMLVSGEYKVAETAELCGYSDIYHFDKQFKALMDITPSQCIPRS